MLPSQGFGIAVLISDKAENGPSFPNHSVSAHNVVKLIYKIFRTWFLFLPLLPPLSLISFVYTFAFPETGSYTSETVLKLTK